MKITMSVGISDNVDIIKAVIWGHEVCSSRSIGSSNLEEDQPQNSERDSTAGSSSKDLVVFYSIHVLNSKGESKVIQKRYNDFHYLLKILRSKYREFGAITMPSKLLRDTSKRTALFNGILRILVSIRPMLPDVLEFFEISSSASPQYLMKLYCRYRITVAGYEEVLDSYGSKVTYYFICVEDSSKENMAYLRKKRFSDFFQLYNTLWRNFPEVKQIFFPSRHSIPFGDRRQQRREALQHFLRLMMQYYPPIHELYNFLSLEEPTYAPTTPSLSSRSLDVDVVKNIYSSRNNPFSNSFSGNSTYSVDSLRDVDEFLAPNSSTRDSNGSLPSKIKPSVDHNNGENGIPKDAEGVSKSGDAINNGNGTEKATLERKLSDPGDDKGLSPFSHQSPHSLSNEEAYLREVHNYGHVAHTSPIRPVPISSPFATENSAEV